MELGDLIGGRWQLTDRLGQGGFGQVYRAVDSSRVGLGAAALKVLQPGTSPEEQSRFLTEVQKVAQMRHPHLVAYLDSGEHLLADGRTRAYLVTELCDYTLTDDLDRRPGRRLAPAEVEELVRHIASGLAHLHQRGLLHRDLKSSNILRGPDGWKLGDFGLTRDISGTGHYHRTGEIIGTPWYMAPELFSDRPSGTASDIYALGVVVHEALTGHFHYEASSDVVLIAAITTREPVLDPSLDPRWRYFVYTLLQRDPDHRPNAGQLLSLLDGTPPLAATPGQPAPSVQPPLTVPAGSEGQSGSGRGRLAYGAVAVLVALLMLGTTAWWLTGRSDTSETPDTPDTPDSTLDAAAGEGTSASAVTSTPSEAALSPEQRVDLVLPTAADGPEGYNYALVPPEPGTEFCIGVDSPTTVFPGVASETAEFSSAAQFFLVRATVHSSVDEAHQYVGYAERLRSTCNGQPIDDSASAPVSELTEATEVDMTGADEFIATSEIATGPTLVVELLSVYARVGDLTILATGSHRGTVEYLAQLAVARATDGPEPEKVEPTAAAPGVFDADAAASVRSLANGAQIMTGTRIWLDSHDDADIDLVMDRVCSSMRDVTDSAGVIPALNEVHDGLSADVRGDLTNNEFAELAGIGVVVYCPEVVDLLTGA